MLVAGKLAGAASLTISEKLRGSERLREIYRRLDGFADTYPELRPQVATVEGPSLGSIHRGFDLGEASGVVKVWATLRYGLFPLVVTPSQLKLFATGNGATKDKGPVVQYAVRRFNHPFTLEANDAADASVLAEIGFLLFSGARPGTRAQAEVVRALKNPAPPLRRTRPRTGITNL